jgi:hypothetical protein
MAIACYLIAVGSGRLAGALSKRLPGHLAPDGKGSRADRQTRSVDFA